MTFSGMTGEIVEVRRSDGELCIEWKIPRFLSLSNGNFEYYDSPRFSFWEGSWFMRVYPNFLGCLALYLHREDEVDSTKTVYIKVGVKGSGGVEWRREVYRKISKSSCWGLNDFCSRSELSEQTHTLMPEDVLVISCQLRIPDTARGVMSNPHSSIQDDSVAAEPESPTNRSLLDELRELPSDVLEVCYEELETATQNFGELSLWAGGCKIDEGAAGTIHRAEIRGRVVAVKRLKEPVDTQFIAELKTLAIYKHENLLALIGYSLGPPRCLLYEYMPKGSLEDRLKCKDQSEPLSWHTRLSISYGSAKGINHLHTFGEVPIVHRDIKSANILLDKNFVPKVGDFERMRTDGTVEEDANGTYNYMAKEAFSGVVSVKFDTFSFGVVLLELLTGLPPRESKDKREDILSWLDRKANWNKEAATELNRIAQRCLTECERSMPTISEILEDLRKLSLLCSEE